MPAETQNPERKIIGAGIGVEAEPQLQFRTQAPGQGQVQVQLQAQVNDCWLDLPGGRMHYLQAGAGPALILVHGLLGYSFSWRFAIPALASHATVYAIDNLGCGLSTANNGIDCTARGTAERILQFADALGIQEFDLLGTSHGGGVAIMVANASVERHDARLRRLILVAPVNPWSPHGKRLAPFVGSPLGAVLFRNTIERWRSLDSVWLRRLFGDASKIPSDSLEGYRIPVLKNHAMRHGSRIVKNWTTDLAEIQKALPTIRDYRTLLMWGTRDRAVDFASAEPLQQNFRDARLVTFDGVGHLPYEEAVADFNRALIDFLTSHQERSE